jgi:hypothetical protein
MDGSGTPRCGDRGQAVLLVLVPLAVAGLLSVGVLRLGAVLVDAAKAQTAADAAALAATLGGEPAAALAALRNGGELRSLRFVDGQVLVTVTVHGITRAARAAGGG